MANILSIKDAIDKAITKTKIGTEYRLAVLRQATRVCVGPMACDYIQYISLKQEVLLIKVTSSTLKSQLMMSKTLLLKNINQQVGEDLAVSELTIL